jgi:hypothetical protein
LGSIFDLSKRRVRAELTVRRGHEVKRGDRRKSAGDIGENSAASLHVGWKEWQWSCLRIVNKKEFGAGRMGIRCGKREI